MEVPDGRKTIYSGIMAFVIVENGVMLQSANERVIAYYGLTQSLPDLTVQRGRMVPMRESPHQFVHDLLLTYFL